MASPLIIVTQKNVPNEVVSRLLEASHPVLFQAIPAAPAREDGTLYPWHKAAETYRDKDKPLVRDVAKLLRQIITGLGPLIGGCLALYGYYRWRQLLRFLEYFHLIQQVDLAAKGLVEMESLPRGQVERTRKLEEQLVQLQQRVVSDFCQNYFYGEGVLANFLVLMNETQISFSLPIRIAGGRPSDVRRGRRW